MWMMGSAPGDKAEKEPLNYSLKTGLIIVMVTSNNRDSCLSQIGAQVFVREMVIT